METIEPMGTIEQRLEKLEREAAVQRDHIEVRQLIASYGPKVDTTDRVERTHLLAQLWTEDGVYDVGGVARFEGREAIAQAFVGRHAEQVDEGICHVMGLPYVRIDGDSALALNYSMVMRPDGAERFYPWRISMNRWDMVRQDGKWLIRNRINRLMTGEAETRAVLRDIDAMAASADR